MHRTPLALLSETKKYVAGKDEQHWFRWFHQGHEAAKKGKGRKPGRKVPKEFNQDYRDGWDSYHDGGE